MKQLDRIEWKLDTILQKLSGEAESKQQVSQPERSGRDTPEFILHNFTTKQHCVLQMICRSASNKEIGDRMGITENSAKVHVRTIAKKLKVNTRTEIVLHVIEALKEIDDASYRLLSGGIPKDWDSTYASEGSAFDHLIFGGKDGTKIKSQG
tara:strand:+ start:325 stop:780 length:456 start_codon:yes stop_codon:yes gene_type:complete